MRVTPWDARTPAQVASAPSHLREFFSHPRVPALPEGAVLHDALFGQVEGSRLTLRSVEWADGPSGRVALGPAEATTATTILQLPTLPAPSRWGLAALPYPEHGRIRSGAMVEHSWGPVFAGRGYINWQTFGVVGLRW